MRNRLTPRQGIVAIVTGIVLGLSVGALVARLPSITLQVGLAGMAGLLVVSLLVAWHGRVLDPAWVVVAGLYTMGPLGAIIGGGGLGVSLLGIAVLAPAPFAAFALAARPAARQGLVLLTPLVVLLVLGWLSTLWSPDPAYGAGKLTLWLANGLLPAAFIIILVRAKGRVSWGLIAAAALLYGGALLAFGAETELYPDTKTAFEGNPIWLARAAFIGALVALFGPFPIAVKGAIAVVTVVAGATTGALGPTLGLLLGAWAGAATWLRLAAVGRRAALGWAAVGASLVVAVVAVFAGGLETATPAIEELTTDINVTSRAAYIERSFGLFTEAPLGGVGIGGFAVTGSFDNYPHNLIVEVAAELGVTGLVVLATWIGLALYGAARSPIYMALVVGTAVYTLFSGNIASNVEFWLFSALAVANVPLGRRVTRPAPEPASGGGIAPLPAPVGGAASGRLR